MIFLHSAYNETVWLFQMPWEQNKRCSNVVCFLLHDLMFVYGCS